MTGAHRPMTSDEKRKSGNAGGRKTVCGSVFNAKSSVERRLWLLLLLHKLRKP